MTKLFLTDFDETLLNSDKTISQENRDAINRLLEAGHYIAFATGRPLNSAKRLIAMLDIPVHHCYLVCFQGSYIYDLENRKMISSVVMHHEKMLSLVNRLLNRGMYLHIFARDKFYCMEYNEFTRIYCEITKEEYEIIPDASALKDKEIYKVMAVSFGERRPLLALQEDIKKEKDFYFEHFFSGEFLYEFCERGQNKGAGLKELAKYLHIPIEQTVSAGDEENDISMIKAAGIGVAMCNARDEIKRQADVITERDNNHGGVAEIIYKYILGDENKNN